MKKYIVILGDQNTIRYKEMVSNLNKLGQVTQVMENLYLLGVTDENNPNADSTRNIRTYLAGNDFNYCFVIYIDNDFASAWSLSKDMSDFVLHFITGGKDETK